MVFTPSSKQGARRISFEIRYYSFLFAIDSDKKWSLFLHPHTHTAEMTNVPVDRAIAITHTHTDTQNKKIQPRSRWNECVRVCLIANITVCATITMIEIDTHTHTNSWLRGRLCALTISERHVCHTHTLSRTTGPRSWIGWRLCLCGWVGGWLVGWLTITLSVQSWSVSQATISIDIRYDR